MISQTGQTEAISGTAVVTIEIYNKSIINTFGHKLHALKYAKGFQAHNP